MSHEFLLAPLDSPPAYASVVDRVRRTIALGLLLPGDRLPPERTMAERLQVSRVTVREAFRVLQGEGLLITRRGSGGTVVSPTATSARPLEQQQDDDLREVFELRLAVETMAARLAAIRADEADFEHLSAAQDALAASSDVNSFRRADSEFHLTVARMSGNSLLRQSIENARAAAFSWLDRRSFTPLRESSLCGHGAVMEAIRAKDPDAAASAMAAHIEQARAEVMAAMEDPHDSGARFHQTDFESVS